ncbi:MAG: diguanylate cyclase [Ruminiclostridium sp.]|nr:diguanylate cyclase [Ruminiclostridium sp.]
MKKALIVRFLIVIAIVMSVCVVSATALLSSTEQNVRKSDMLTSLGLIREIYEDEPNHDYDLANRLSSLIGNARVSFINKEGTVFVDTYIDGEPNDNHNNREEIKQAELTGSGVAVRYSKTLGKNQIYAAMKVKDDDIIRISYNINSYMDFASMFIAPMLIAAAIGIITGLIAVSSVARQIMKPINSISEAMSSMKYVGDDKVTAELEEIPAHKYPELDEFVTMFNFMRKSIQDNMKTLENEREKERFILESLQDGVILYGNDLSVISINRAGLKLLGASADSRISTIPELARKPEIISGAEKAANEDKTVTIDSTVDGRILLVQVFPVSKSGIDAMHGGLMVIRDVTDKRMSEQLKADFFANAGHELKTPLTAISGFAELLENGLVPKDKKDYYIGKILTEAKRMSTIISDILEISSLENKTAAEEVTDCKLLEICTAVKECLEPTAAAKNVTIDLSGDGFTVRAAYKHIYELVENIVSNAIKYNKDGGKVEIKLHDVGEIGCIYVKDNGIGIPKESLSRVFERFYRVDKGRSTKEGSTGLGLSIVKHIVNCYGGTVTIDSELGKGTLVCVKLPIAKGIEE